MIAFPGIMPRFSHRATGGCWWAAPGGRHEADDLRFGRHRLRVNASVPPDRVATRDAVRTAFAGVAAEHGALPGERAAAYVGEPEATTRYRPDLWG
jgi:hypothetical protein